MGRFIKSRTSVGMSDEDIVYALRLAFQQRVDDSFTLTDTEAEELLIAYPVHVLLEAFTSAGAYLRLQKRDNLIFYDAEETLDILKRDIVEVSKAYPARRMPEEAFR